MFKAAIGTFALLTLALPPAAAELPGNHESLIEGAALEGLKSYASPAHMILKDVVLEGTRPGRARTYTVTDPGPRAWSRQAILSINLPVKKGDICLIRFRVKGRATARETGEAVFTVFAQKNGPDWEKSVSVTQSATPEWKQVDIPFAWKADYGPGKCALGFGFGLQAQEVTIADLQVLRFDASVHLKDLPTTGPSYEGRAPDAPWRAEAEARIRRHRMASLRVRVVDAEGKPVKGARVMAEMRRHAFPFGSAVQMWRWFKEDRDHQLYREHFLELFNAASTENELKWPAWDGQWGSNYNRANTLEALRWFSDRDIPVRGHVLVWPGWRHLPRSIRDLKDRPDEIPGAVEHHIEDILGVTGDLITEWDVINEPYSNTDLEELLGREAFVDWFKQARRLRPEAGLYLNDYAILSAAGLDRPHQAHFESMVRYLKENGAPITGMGMQGHFGGSLTPPERLLRILDRYAETGLDIRITEFDVASTDEQLKADYLRDFLTAIFSHPGVVGFQLWGFWAKAHWKPEAAWFQEDWTPLPVVDAYKRLVFDAWWSNEVLTSGRDGRASADAFLGDYRITTSQGNRSVTIDHTLTRDGDEVVVKLGS